MKEIEASHPRTRRVGTAHHLKCQFRICGAMTFNAEIFLPCRKMASLAFMVEGSAHCWRREFSPNLKKCPYPVVGSAHPVFMVIDIIRLIGSIESVMSYPTTKRSNTLTQNLEARHAMILHQERVLSYQLAKVMIKKPKVSVWMVMLPLLFLFFIQDVRKYKVGIRDFADGFFKNKKIALDLTLKAMLEDVPLKEALTVFASNVEPVLSDQMELHEKQMKEIAYLMMHYRRLLTAQGDTYEALIKNTFGSAADYQRFLDGLADLEREVIRSALTFARSDGIAKEVETPQELAKLMQNAMRQIRRRECDRIFSAK
jgi:hypothetical protein